MYGVGWQLLLPVVITHFRLHPGSIHSRGLRGHSSSCATQECHHNSQRYHHRYYFVDVLLHLRTGNVYRPCSCCQRHMHPQLCRSSCCCSLDCGNVCHKDYSSRALLRHILCTDFCISEKTEVTFKTCINTVFYNFTA